MSTTTTRRAPRPTTIKLALAAVAVLGVGAALTSAAWTDDAWFTAEASAGTVELQGRPVAVDSEQEFEWSDADEDAPVLVPADRLAGLVPDEVRTFDIELRNASTVPIYVTELEPVVTGDLFADGSPATITTSWTDTEMQPDDVVPVTVTVSAGDLSDELQGADGQLTLVFRGSTALP